MAKLVAYKKKAKAGQKKKGKKTKPANKNQKKPPVLEGHFLRTYGLWIIIGGLCVVLGLGQFFDAAFAWLAGGLVVLLAIVCYDIYVRRDWEKNLTVQIVRLATDYERLVREVARNRNDIAAFKRGLSNAGEAAQLQNRGKNADSRVLQVIIDRLLAMGDSPRPLAERTAPPAPQIKPVGPIPVGRDEGEFIASQIGDDVVLELLRHALRYDKVELFLQPVVLLPQRKVKYYEVFSRLHAKPGLYLPAERYISVASKHGLVAAIDNMLLLNCLQMIRDMEEGQRPESCFVNIAGMTLHDSKFMGDLVEFLSQHHSLAPRLIFEFTEQDLNSLDASIFPVIDGLAKLGCRFSVDQVQSVSLNLSTLKARHIRFVKMEAQTLLSILNGLGGLRRLQQFKAELDRNGIDLIVEKIEVEKDLLELLDLDIDFGQGYLFGHPELQADAA